MNYTEIIKLLDKGFTREEILQMQEPAPEDKQEDPAPEDKQEDPAPVSMDAVMSEVKDMFAEMKKELTAMNILNSRQKAEEQNTADDIIANIINPTRTKNGGN